MSNKIKEMAPEGQVWVCGACGKYDKNRYNVGDVSCYINSTLCYDDDTLKIEDGRVIEAKAVEEEK